jgi:hypothetical protein
MLIEYKIKFEKDGLTIAQYIEPNSSRVANTRSTNAQATGLPATQTEVTGLANANPLANVAQDGGGQPFGDIGGQPFGDIGGGGGGGVQGGAAAPIFILGPIVFGNSAPPEIAKSVEPTAPDTPPKALGTTAGN